MALLPCQKRTTAGNPLQHSGRQENKCYKAHFSGDTWSANFLSISMSLKLENIMASNSALWSGRHCEWRQFRGLCPLPESAEIQRSLLSSSCAQRSEEPQSSKSVTVLWLSEFFKIHFIPSYSVRKSIPRSQSVASLCSLSNIEFFHHKNQL